MSYKRHMVCFICGDVAKHGVRSGDVVTHLCDSHSDEYEFSRVDREVRRWCHAYKESLKFSAAYDKYRECLEEGIITEAEFNRAKLKYGERWHHADN